MSDQLYAVMRHHEDEDEPQLLTVFSNEGLAQTHAAKLRVLQEYDTVYTVKPLQVDEAANEDLCYYATHMLDIDDLQYDLSEIIPEAANVAEVLPACMIDVDTTYGTVEFTDYGWSPEDAKRRLQSLIEDFIAMRRNKLSADKAEQLAKKQAAAAALRAKLAGTDDDDWVL